jgi:hypothetical protein
LESKLYLKSRIIVIGLAGFILLFNSCNWPLSALNAFASESDSHFSSHIQDVIIRIKPVEGWKRGSLATVGNEPSIFNAIDKSKIAFPVNWNVTERAGKVILVPADLKTQNNTLSAMIISAYPSEYASIDESAKIATDMYKSELDDFKLLSINQSTISSEPAIALTYNYVEPQIGKINVMEVAAIHGQKEYLIQYFSSDNKSPDNISLLTSIVNSLKFKS